MNINQSEFEPSWQPLKAYREPNKPGGRTDSPSMPDSGTLFDAHYESECMLIIKSRYAF